MSESSNNEIYNGKSSNTADKMFPTLRAGLAVLQHYLNENPIVFDNFSVADFKNWLEKQIAYKQQDLAFLYRCQIRDLKKQHYTTLLTLQEKLDISWNAWQQSKNFTFLERLEKKKIGLQKAIEGLQQTIAESNDKKKEQCQKKHDEYQQELISLLEEEKRLLSETKEKIIWQNCQIELENFQQKVGITDIDEKLKQINRNIGHQSSEVGSNFEQCCYNVLCDYIIPLIASNTKGIQILKQVKLGCSRAEFDYLLIQSKENSFKNLEKEKAKQPISDGSNIEFASSIEFAEIPADSIKPVKVLAIIEAKRNPNDIASGFLMRQENLAWFTGDHSGYDPEIYRTKEFRQGHFDRPAYHIENNKEFLFTTESFCNFKRASNSNFMDNLFFITTQRPLLGVSIDEYARIMYHISTEISFDLTNIYLEKCLSWIHNIIAKKQTREILGLYLNNPIWAQQIIFVKK